MTTQKALAWVLGFVILIGGIAIAITQMRKGKAELGSEIELASNRREYLPDDELEGPKLNKALWTAFGLLVVLALALPMYWLAEPGRQSGAVEHANEIFVQRGEEMYTTGAQCVNCHGPKGVGGSAKFIVTDENGKFVKSVSWTAPALNTVLYRFSVPEVMDILTYGRPGTPMPAWGVKGGGPNTDQQLSNVIKYLWTVQLTPDEVRTEVDEAVKASDAGLYDRMIANRKKNEGILDPSVTECEKGVECYQRMALADELELGEILFNLNRPTTGTNAISCARCHVPGASFGEPWTSVQETAKGALAPNLIGIENRLTEKQHFLLVMNGTEFGKQYGSVGLGSGKMPGFGVNANNGTPDDVRQFGTAGLLSPEQVWAIVAYERGLSSERPDLRVAGANGTAGTTTGTTAGGGGNASGLADSNPNATADSTTTSSTTTSAPGSGAGSANTTTTTEAKR